jgi:pyrroline-5-carboxylate reductase
MERKNLKVAVIGAGNMGEALIGGMLHAGLTSKDRIVASDAASDRLKRIGDSLGIRCVKNNLEAVRDAEVILLAVKPQNLPSIREELQGRLTEKQLVISILAGVPVAKLRAALGEGPAIVRVMPNLPALIGQGMSVVAGDSAEAGHIELAQAILSTVGEVVVLPESRLDAVTALSGSGPGYVYLFIECLAEAGEAVGLPREAARQMAIKTFVGACQLMDSSDETPEELRRRVTSPGGTTEAGIKAFEELGLRDTFKAALERSTERARELGRG